MADTKKTAPGKSSALRQLPSVEKLLEAPQVRAFADQLPQPVVAEVIRTVVDECRKKIDSGQGKVDLPALLATLQTRLVAKTRQALEQVVNGTGVILHTNLGRAPLGEEVIAAMAQAARQYVNLEYRLSDGTRGSRGAYAEELLCQLFGCEAAAVVNNNAGALFLALSAMAKGKEVVISRGELVQIGGGFRIPEILAESGAVLREVGTTNQTELADYRRALGPQTGLILKVHSSNFLQVGFVRSVSVRDLVLLGQEHGVPVMEDIGSGAVPDTAEFGLKTEPTVGGAVSAGCNVVSFSGDKLFGGPQAGILVGKKEIVERLKKHPLYRALRVDKIIFAAIEVLARQYLTKATDKIPVWQMITLPIDTLQKRAQVLAKELTGDKITVRVVECRSTVGGGSLPGETIPSSGLEFESEVSPHEIAAVFRGQSPPVIGRIENDRFLIDLRTVFPDQDKSLVTAAQQVFKK